MAAEQIHIHPRAQRRYLHRREARRLCHRKRQMGGECVHNRRCLSQLRPAGSGRRDDALRRHRQNTLSAISPGALARKSVRARVHLFPTNDVGIIRSLAPGSDRFCFRLRPNFFGRDGPAGQILYRRENGCGPLLLVSRTVRADGQVQGVGLS